MRFSSEHSGETNGGTSLTPELRRDLHCQRAERSPDRFHTHQPPNGRYRQIWTQAETPFALALPPVEGVPRARADKSGERRGWIGCYRTDKRSGGRRGGGVGSGGRESCRGREGGEDDIVGRRWEARPLERWIWGTGRWCVCVRWALRRRHDMAKSDTTRAWNHLIQSGLCCQEHNAAYSSLVDATVSLEMIARKPRSELQFLNAIRSR